MIKRDLTDKLSQLATQYPVITLTGPRQSENRRWTGNSPENSYVVYGGTQQLNTSFGNYVPIASLDTVLATFSR